MPHSGDNGRALVGLVLLALGCGKTTGGSGSGGGTTADTHASAAPAPSAASASASSAATPPAAASSPSPVDARAALYPLATLKPLAESCATPAVILATAPASVGDGYAWPVSRQAFLANQQFGLVSRPPAAHREVRLSTFHDKAFGPPALVLVATCGDAATCNQVAAMYQAVVRSSSPQLLCGTPPGITGSPLSFAWAADPKDDLPAAGDTEAQCARLNACMLTYRADTPGDPFLDCRGGKAHFDTSCASHYPCADVLACAPAVPSKPAKTLGDPCGKDADCADIGSILPYCNRGHCGLSCLGANPCGNGYVCVPIGGGHGECVVDPTPPDMKLMGHVCQLPTDCHPLGPAGICDHTGAGVDDGHCTLFCKTDHDCPSAMRCTPAPLVGGDVCRAK